MTATGQAEATVAGRVGATVAGPAEATMPRRAEATTAGPADATVDRNDATNPRRGRFLVVEGGEGAGKTTQVRLLAAFLRERGLQVVETREPGGTQVGEGIRRLLLEQRADVRPADVRRADMSPACELLLILAARAAFVREVVEPALAAGTWVVSDRFEMSTFAYQGCGRGVPMSRIEPMNRFATDGLKPDLCLVLDLSPEEGMARHARAGKAPDRFESSGTDFLRRVAEGYAELSRTMEGAVRVPAMGGVEEVARRIRREVEERLPEVADLLLERSQQ